LHNARATLANSAKAYLLGAILAKLLHAIFAGEEVRCN
jgi:hypothetical protein